MKAGESDVHYSVSPFEVEDEDGDKELNGDKELKGEKMGAAGGAHPSWREWRRSTARARI